MMVLALIGTMFVLTVLLEGAVILVWFRSWRYVYYSFLCNLLTNPALNALLALTVGVWGVVVYTPVLAGLEFTVLIVEAYVWHILTEFGWKKALMVSFITNGVSFVSGLLLSPVIKNIFL